MTSIYLLSNVPIANMIIWSACVNGRIYSLQSHLSLASEPDTKLLIVYGPIRSSVINPSSSNFLTLLRAEIQGECYIAQLKTDQVALIT